MNMMEPDVGGEPRKRLGKEIVRTASQSGGLLIPVGFIDPKSIFELMLYIKQPDAD